MSKALQLSLMCGLLCASTTALAQTSRPTSQPTSRPDRKSKVNKRVVPADVSEKNATRLLLKMMWHSDLEKAKARAKKEKKLIFWMHSVGELSGKL